MPRRAASAQIEIPNIELQIEPEPSSLALLADVPIKEVKNAKPIEPQDPPVSKGEDRFALALSGEERTLKENGFQKKLMKNDYSTGILCKEEEGTLSFFFDLKHDETVFFDFESEATVYHYPNKITVEQIEGGGYRYHTASQRRDLDLFYTFEAVTFNRKEGTGSLSLSRNYPPKDSDRKIAFVCKDRQL